ncbi:MAG: phosphoribosylanthranilate isomerase [Gammaproteobacteria bacterium]|nr:phosphoribosylanthranilate isomerase [Gammaproteobacteria bacterium]MBV9724004.1 phosphoribosylanthranilate isomerase [Gammaproteobacteria bacterium]
MWIKICGITTPAAVEAALEERVDAIGFVFARSVRELTPAAAAALARAARGRVSCVAVTRHPSQTAVDEIVRLFAPDLLQSDAEDFATLRLPDSLETLAVVREGAPLPAPLPGRVLYEGPDSGRGRVIDWSVAAALACHTQLVLAGGLNEANVSRSIAQVQPFGVDVSSGVEERPGMKSPAAIKRFVAAVRAAAAAPT